jgi:hypothetical protein
MRTGTFDPLTFRPFVLPTGERALLPADLDL